MVSVLLYNRTRKEAELISTFWLFCLTKYWLLSRFVDWEMFIHVHTEVYSKTHKKSTFMWRLYGCETVLDKSVPWNNILSFCIGTRRTGWRSKSHCCCFAAISLLAICTWTLADNHTYNPHNHECTKQNGRYYNSYCRVDHSSKKTGLVVFKSREGTRMCLTEYFEAVNW